MPVELVDDPARAAALLSPERLRIVGALGEGEDGADSAAGVARRVGLPRQKVNYHLRELERRGLVELVEERKKGNCMERIVRPVAAEFVIAPPSSAGPGARPTLEDKKRAQDRFAWTTLVRTFGRVLSDLATLRRRADSVDQRLATFGIDMDVRFASPAAMKKFAEDLAREAARLAAEHHDDEAKRGRVFKVVVGMHPAITKTEDEADREAREHAAAKSDSNASTPKKE